MRSGAGRLGLLAVTMATLVTGLAGPAVGSPQQRVVDLGTLGGCCSQAAAINDRGEVVGDSNVGLGVGGPSHAFLWSHGDMIDLGTLGGVDSAATDINDRGEVVGVSALPDGARHAVLWRHGSPTDLGTLGGSFSFATAMNDAGQVVGFSTTAPGSFELHAFSWRAGTMTDLGLLDGGFARAYDVNDRGQVVGDSAVDAMNSVPVRWQRDRMIGLSTDFGQGSAINDRGQVTGYFFGGHGSFLWSHGRLTDLGALSGSTFTQAFGINNRGAVVGSSDFDAFLWQRGRMTALPRLAGGATAAYDINDSGQIVGHSATNSDGTNSHAVLWTS